jgi:hypothetical protein
MRDECAMIATMACDEDLANRWAMQSVAFASASPPKEKK